jgi:hypothetical protein
VEEEHNPARLNFRDWRQRQVRDAAAEVLGIARSLGWAGDDQPQMSQAVTATTRVE